MANNITLPGTLGAAILRTITRIIGGQEVHSQAMFEVNPGPNVSGVLSAVGDVVEIDVTDAKSLTFAVNGTYTTGALAFECAGPDRLVWYAMDAARTTGNSIEAVSGNMSNLTRAWETSVGGFAYFRVRLTALTSGSINVLLMPSHASYDPSPAIQSHSVTMENRAALADNVTNPTEGRSAADQYQFNGTTWDRQRNNWNTTTGDTGAKTASLNGATQTNYNASGAVIAFNIGAVGGTNPTLNIKLQESADGGTTWFDVPGAALPTITASGLYVLTIHPAATPVANSIVAFPLTRTWRAVYTIGGTAPSFTITNVQVAYVD